MYVGLFYRTFILGDWVAGEGAIFEMFDHNRHVVDIVPQIERWIGVGIDFGVQNPFAALMGGVGVDRRLYVTAEWRHDGRKSRHQLTTVEYVERLQGWWGNLVHPGPKLGQADVDSYQAFQHKLGFTGSAATWPPGPTSWDKLQVPKVV